MKKTTGTITRYFLFSFMVLFLSTCEDPFRPDLSEIEIENALVVEGFITDEDVAHQIRLTRSVPLGATSVPKELGATVQVIDQNGNSHTLTEEGQGVYLTNASEFRAQAGNSYQLRFQLADGQTYESTFQELIPTDPIDSIWYQRATEEIIRDNSIETREAVKFFTNYDTHDEQAYYRYDYFGTYAWRAELQGNTVCWEGNQGDPPADLQANLLCYVTESNRMPLNISRYPDPVNGSNGFEEVFSLNFNERFIDGFSLAVRKYTLTEDYHNFLEAVVDQQEFGGSIFDSPPTQIVGNIRNINDPKEVALGYFGTLSQNVKRIFIPGIGGIRPEDRCFFDLDDPFLFVPPARDCCDCRARVGSSVNKPSFWPN